MTSLVLAAAAEQFVEVWQSVEELPAGVLSCLIAVDVILLEEAFVVFGDVVEERIGEVLQFVVAGYYYERYYAGLLYLKEGG